jgi:tetratricopeptide (TPR) repeat protein
MRVNAQLIDAESGAHLWADRFEEDVIDLLKLQDQVVARLANALGYELVKAEAQKGVHSNNPDVIDLALRGWSLIWRGIPQPLNEKRDTFYKARALFERALEVDPDDADSLAGSAYTYYFDFQNGWGDPGTDYEAKVLEPTNRAIALSRDNLRGYVVKAIYLSNSRRSNEALGVVDAGLALNPNFAALLQSRAIAENSLGRYEQAKADAQLAMRLSPRDPSLGALHLITGVSEFGLGHLDAAIDQLHQATDTGFGAYFVYSNLSAAYALAGKMEEAKAAMAEARRLNPKLTTIKWLMEHTGVTPAALEALRTARLLPEE